MALNHSPHYLTLHTTSRRVKVHHTLSSAKIGALRQKKAFFFLST